MGKENIGVISGCPYRDLELEGFDLRVHCIVKPEVLCLSIISILYFKSSFCFYIVHVLIHDSFAYFDDLFVS